MIKPYLYYEIRNTYKATYEYRYGTTEYRGSCTTKHAKKALEKTENTRRTLASMRSILNGELRRRPRPAPRGPEAQIRRSPIAKKL